MKTNSLECTCRFSGDEQLACFCGAAQCAGRINAAEGDLHAGIDKVPRSEAVHVDPATLVGTDLVDGVHE